eukprot:1154813-Pleurochrysis_carterae.AAC.1
MVIIRPGSGGTTMVHFRRSVWPKLRLVPRLSLLQNRLLGANCCRAVPGGVADVSCLSSKEADRTSEQGGLDCARARSLRQATDGRSEICIFGTLITHASTPDIAGRVKHISHTLDKR